MQCLEKYQRKRLSENYPGSLMSEQDSSNQYRYQCLHKWNNIQESTAVGLSEAKGKDPTEGKQKG